MYPVLFRLILLWRWEVERTSNASELRFTALFYMEH
jgi:hypothetical protein